MRNKNDIPPLLRDFLTYHETIMGHSKNTVDEYYLDLRLYFRFLKLSYGLVPSDTDIDDISISRLSGKDVVRHRLVQEIIKAYERNSEKK